MHDEDEFIPISALQHYLFCERQCALIYIEQAWEENLLTAEGKIMHEKAHENRFEIREGVRIERGMPLRSVELGLNGRADVVEYHKTHGNGPRKPFPIEYKHGRPKANDCDKVQLCAQALCLEEMLGVAVPAGAIYYGKTRHRFDVPFDEDLRAKTVETIKRVREFTAAGVTPRPFYSSRCDSCSLAEVCKPKVFERATPVARYLAETLREKAD